MVEVDVMIVELRDLLAAWVDSGSLEARNLYLDKFAEYEPVISAELGSSRRTLD